VERRERLEHVDNARGEDVTMAGRTTTKLLPVFVLLLGIGVGAVATRLFLAQRLSTASYLASRIDRSGEYRTAGTVRARLIGRLVVEARQSMESEREDGGSMPLKALLRIWFLDKQDGPPVTVQICRKSDLIGVCSGIETAVRAAFPYGTAVGTYSRGELILEFPDGTSSVVWLSDVGFSTDFLNLTDDCLFYSPELAQTLCDVLEREGKLDGAVRAIFEGQLAPAPLE
jgi:hypothetical protein